MSYFPIPSVVKQLKLFYDMQGDSTYLITESFNHLPPKSYKLVSLLGRIEKGIVYFHDKDDEIYKHETRALMAFRVKDATAHYTWEIGENWILTITFADGTITIERLDHIAELI